jgi:hypothetical protein
MTKTIILSTVAIALTGSAVMLAQAQQQAPQMNPDLASFFIADNPNGTGNLGELAGADQRASVSGPPSLIADVTSCIVASGTVAGAHH